ncbi:MAG: hypothetical protein IPJ61_17715 [Tessaracoccus sp.]|uniref:DUF7694 domain-containing protein n=1 Tax=Tessaracoccus sp. TaxID=1971211 RepID=UPI001EBDD3DA|nr:hypothetical protein [Tessaracoccus sp.]MBK7822842.1 hypothetical protein [Tessaracoccus sp.]
MAVPRLPRRPLRHRRRGRRLSINRTDYSVRRGDWRDGIGWDDLQRIKTQCLGEDVWAVEIYPPPSELVDVANMRHLWVLDEAPTYGWQGERR